MKTILNIVHALYYATRSTADQCNRVLRLKAVTDLLPCDQENKHLSSFGGLMGILKSIIKPTGEDCWNDILIDGTSLAESLAATNVCKDIKVIAGTEINEVYTDGTTTIDTAIPYADYIAGGELANINVNGVSINETSDPRTATIVDNGGNVQIVFNNGLGAPNDPCNVEITIWAVEVCTVIVCPAK